jgi:ribonuclease J
MNSPALKVIPLGGLGEVGLNILVLECGPDILLIDCGVLFPDLAWLGLDLVLPDFTYLVENAKRIKALVITHGHEDHIGAIPFLLREVAVPKIYASSFASALIQEKCQEYGVIHQLKIYPVVAGDTVRAGQFECEFIHVTHSTLESFALAIKTPHGMVIHSGDFKFDETPYCGPTSNKERFRELAQKEQPLLLLSDSTNSERCGHSRSESDITNEIEKLISDTKGAAIVTLFASNIHRVHQVMDIAERVGRKIFLSGRSMERYVNIALDQRHLPRKGNLIQPLENIEDFPRNKILVLSTGSQGEARSSLYRLAKDENRWIKIKTGDSVILSSRHIPGNEKAVNAIINQLFKLGADVFYEDVHSVHASGHAHQEEQLELLGYVRPKYFLPVHGEYRQLLLHKRTAEKSGFVSDGCHLIENGQIWEFDGLGAQVLPSGVPVGRKW